MKGISLLILSFSFNLAFAQELQFLWAESLGYSEVTTYDRCRSIEYDNEGNVYSAGNFSGTVDFDPSIEEHLITSVHGQDAYLQKLDENGALLWVKNFGAQQEQLILDLDIDLEGNIVILGEFRDTVDFDPGPSEALLYTNGFTDVFIVKLDADGNYLWSKNIACKSHDSAGGIEFDFEGNVLVSTSYRDTLSLPFEAGTIELVPIEMFDMAILKYNPLGELMWAKTIGGFGQKIVRDHTVDLEGNVFVTGIFDGTIDVDPSEDEYSMTSEGFNDFFLVKLNHLGEFIWAHQIGGSLEQFSNRCITDDYGNLLLVGGFQSVVDFDPGPDNLILTSKGFMDCFIQKFNPAGELLWVRQIGGSYNDDVLAIDVDAYKNIYITGEFQHEVDFDPGDEEFIIDSDGYDNVFIQKMNDHGEFIWAKDMGGLRRCTATDIRVDNDNNIYLTGDFSRSIDLNPSPEFAIFAADEGFGGDIFVAKYSQCGSASHHTVNNCESYTWPENDSTYYTSGTYTHLLTNAMGCDSIVNLHLTIGIINSHVILTDLTTAIAVESGTYQWVDCDNDYEIIPGETDSSFTASHSGSYAVIITDGTCIDTSNCVDLIELIGLDELISTSTMLVYPNPLTDFTTIYLPQNTVQNSTILICDLLGKEVFRSELINEDKLQISNIGFEAGIYMVLQIESTSGKIVATSKLEVK